MCMCTERSHRVFMFEDQSQGIKRPHMNKMKRFQSLDYYLPFWSFGTMEIMSDTKL